MSCLAGLFPSRLVFPEALWVVDTYKEHLLQEVKKVVRTMKLINRVDVSSTTCGDEMLT